MLVGAFFLCFRVKFIKYFMRNGISRAVYETKALKWLLDSVIAHVDKVQSAAKHLFYYIPSDFFQVFDLSCNGCISREIAIQ